jgi:LysM domain
MGSLTAHLRETGDHGRLRFHPSCPVCRRERLYGTLSTEPVIPVRARALLAGGVLAVSASAPAVSIAQEPDRQSEGIVAPEEAGGPELDDPSFDPGGDDALSFDTAPAPSASDDGSDTGDGVPLDVEPTVDLDARLAPLADAGPEVSDEQAAVPPAEVVAPGGAAAPGEAPAPVTPSPSGAAPPPTPPASGTDGPNARQVGSAQLEAQANALRAGQAQTRPSRPARYTQAEMRPGPDAPASSPRVGDGAGAPAEPYAAPVPATTASASLVTASAAEAQEPAPEDLSPGSRFHVVQPGDSLWSIAKQLLGSDAPAGRIAREVDRLWTLNRSRIATGDPDLLMVGTRLELR